MINIVYIIPCFRKAGPVNVVFDIVRNIDRDRFKVTVIALRKETGSLCSLDKFRRLNVCLVELPYNKIQILLFPKRIATEIKKILRPLKTVVIHSHCHRPNIICKYINEYPKLTTVHNISIEDYVNGAGVLVGKYLSWQYNRTLKYFDTTAVISEYMMEYYAKWAKNLVKISNGVSVKARTTIDKRVFRQQNNIVEGMKVLLIVGMLIPRKNVEFAISQLKKANSKFVCLIIGEGQTLESSMLAAGEDERFRFMGFKSNIADYLSIADLYISTSLSEGLPLSVLEAANCGVPCLLSNIRPHIEIVNELNVEGVECFKLESDQLASKVDLFLSKSYNREIISDTAHQYYSSDVMTRKYEYEYKKLLK